MAVKSNVDEKYFPIYGTGVILNRNNKKTLLIASV